MRQPIQPQKNFHLLFLTSVAVRFQSGGMIEIVEFKADFRYKSLDTNVEKKSLLGRSIDASTHSTPKELPSSLPHQRRG